MRPTKTMSQSVSIRENIVLPGDTNEHDTLFGGILMKYIDETAAISARRHAGKPCVTASIDGIHFHRPIVRNSILRMTSFVCSVGRSSMEVYVQVQTEIASVATTAAFQVAAVAFCTFVALEQDGTPSEVPFVSAETDVQKRLVAGELERRQARLRKRSETIELIRTLDPQN